MPNGQGRRGQNRGTAGLGNVPERPSRQVEKAKFAESPIPRTWVKKPKTRPHQRMHRYRCVAIVTPETEKTASMGRGREARPIEERGTL